MKTKKKQNLSVNPTLEQQFVMQKVMDSQAGDIVMVEAYAGASKTTTLILTAERFINGNPQKQVLYLAFNKSIQTEAEAKFGETAKVQTFHSYAYGATNARERFQCGNRARTIRVRNVSVAFDCDRQLASDAIETLDRFFISDSDAISFRHLIAFGHTATTFFKPDTRKDIFEQYGSETAIRRKKNQYAHEVISLARDVFAGACSNDPAYPTSQDAYLKEFQLSKSIIPYDLILFDERQDANRCMLSIFENQPKSTVVMVGDSNQSIYGWRGGEIESVNCCKSGGR